MFGHKSILVMAKEGDLQGIKDKIKRNKNLNKIDSTGKSVITIASESGHQEIVNLLESNGVTQRTTSPPPPPPPIKSPVAPSTTTETTSNKPVSANDNKTFFELAKVGDLAGIQSRIEKGGQDIEEKDKNVTMLYNFYTFILHKISWSSVFDVMP